MADSIDLLSTIVEFSIGLAGFSGVVGIFLRRSGDWAYVDRFRLTNLLIMSLMPGFLAFFALGLLQTLTPQHSMQVAAAAFVASVALTLIFIPRARSRVPEEDKHLVGLTIFVPMSATFAAILLLQALVALSVIEKHAFLVYYFSLVVVLFLAVVQFARIILARPSQASN